MVRTEGAMGNRAARTGLVLAIALAVSLLLAVAFSPARVLAQNGQADDADDPTGSNAPTFEAPQNLPRYAPDRVIVGLEKGVSEGALEEPKDETGARERFEINDGRVEVLTLPESSGTSALEAVAAFSEAPGIAYAERDAVLVATDVPVPNDARFGNLWGLHNTGQFYGSVADADTDAPEAWTVNKGGGVVVGVIDSGVDASHPDLEDNMWTNPGEVPGNGVDDDNNGYVDDIHGWD
jgi:subtilisin family serine protease